MMMMRPVVLLLLAASIGQAASMREIAEWVIRWEGQFTVEGSRRPIGDLIDIPEGGFEIVSVDLTGAVMPPAELAMLSELTSLRELHLPGPIWNPGGGRQDASEGPVLGGRRRGDEEETKECQTPHQQILAALMLLHFLVALIN